MSTLTDRPRPRPSPKQIRQRLRTDRRQQARKARATRRRIERVHQQLPKPVRTIFDPIEPVFSRPTHRRYGEQWRGGGRKLGPTSPRTASRS